MACFSKVKVWKEKVTIPTYKIGKPDKNPMFLEKRVYQGSSGKVYPHSVIDKITDEKEDKEYTALYLENDFIKVMVLPELGGRIQRAADKTNGYDFVYYNSVIKPALVGLAGPWISGGIEFNWPQHHRPSTFDPVNYDFFENKDGSATIVVGEIENMFRTEDVTRITLYPDSTYIEIKAQLYNRTNVPQTFLWWANPAVSVNDKTRSIFPPDVTAVMDHGKRDMSTFPIATGTYYKVDYSKGVDISRYKNLPVPTSYMAAKSDFNFVGFYDDGKKAGILHVADHHISPGKKQWTWGCGDFGKAWDRNLTDSDGPYVELMTGCFTDNQPDFSYIAPMEERRFTQYFMPYKKLGTVHNATRDLALHIENGKAALYATGNVGDIEIVIIYEGKKETHKVKMLPCDYLEYDAAGAKGIEVYKDNKKYLDFYLDFKKQPIPEIAKCPPVPRDCKSNEELYLYGLHIEKYRHATYNPDDYYLEGLKRDSGDIRINNAYGLRLLKSGLYKESEKHFREAIARMNISDTNPYDSEPIYNLGLALLHEGKVKKAYDAFYKSAWCDKCEESAFYQLACIAAREGDFELSLSHIENALIHNAHNYKALNLKTYLLIKLSKDSEATENAEKVLMLDPLDTAAKVFLNKDYAVNDNTAIETALDFAAFGDAKTALRILQKQKSSYPLLCYYIAYFKNKCGDKNFQEDLAHGDEMLEICFPHRLEDIEVLKFAINFGSTAAPYLLGCLYYDKRRYDDAIDCFNLSIKRAPKMPCAHRCLALAFYNKKHDETAAIREMEKAQSLDQSDMRVLMELDLLYKMTAKSSAERLKNLEKYEDELKDRDDLTLEYITLLNLEGKYESAYKNLMSHKFHPWEGGEGKVPEQYKYSLTALAFVSLQNGDTQKAKELINKTFTYPYSLGEGKLYGTKENLQNYLLGLCFEKEGESEKAKVYFETASKGLSKPASAVYYNDQPPETIFCQGMALLKLNEKEKAENRFDSLIEFCDKHIDDDVKIDYFAVSLPDFLVFDADLNLKNRVHCLFMKSLGLLGKGEKREAQKTLDSALKLNPSYVGAALYKQIFFD